MNKEALTLKIKRLELRADNINNIIIKHQDLLIPVYDDLRNLRFKLKCVVEKEGDE